MRISALVCWSRCRWMLPVLCVLTAAPTFAQDTLESLSEALDACIGSDLIVFSGGSSVGTRDLVVDRLVSISAATSSMERPST